MSVLISFHFLNVTALQKVQRMDFKRFTPKPDLPFNLFFHGFFKYPHLELKIGFLRNDGSGCSFHCMQLPTSTITLPTDRFPLEALLFLQFDSIHCATRP